MTAGARSESLVEGASFRARGYALVALAAISWGCWPWFLRRAEAIAKMPPALESVVMMGVVTLVSAPFCLRDRIRRRATLVEWAGIGWLGFADALNAVLFFAAYQATSVAIAVLTHYLAPIFVACGAPFVVGEKPRAQTFLAVATAFCGLLLLLAPWSAERHPRDWLGAALGAGSALFYASNVLVNKRLVGTFSGSELMFFHGLVAVPVLALLVPAGAVAAADGRALAVVVAGSVVAGALAGLFFVWGLRRIAASHASTLALLEPLVAVVVASVAFGEPLRPLSLVGGLLILGGAALVVVR